MTAVAGGELAQRRVASWPVADGWWRHTRHNAVRVTPQPTCHFLHPIRHAEIQDRLPRYHPSALYRIDSIVGLGCKYKGSDSIAFASIFTEPPLVGLAGHLDLTG